MYLRPADSSLTRAFRQSRAKVSEVTVSNLINLHLCSVKECDYVDVVIDGEEGQTSVYYLPRQLLSTSPITAKYLEKIPKGPLPRLKVETIHDETFRLYVSWLYVGSYKDAEEQLSEHELPGNQHGTVRAQARKADRKVKKQLLRTNVDAWMLGERVEDRDFQDYAMWRLIH